MARFIITGEYKDKATRDARKDLKGLSKETDLFSKISKKAWRAAQAAAIYYATKGLKKAFDAAVADEKSQRALALTLTTVAGATDAAVIATEANISAMSKTFGIADDQLRPAFARLARITGSVSNASNDLNLALSLSAATGASLETTTGAITKAYQGNYKSLKSLGIKLDENLVKQKDTRKILKQVQATYGEFANKQLDTTAVKLNKIKVAAGEASETIGYELINALNRLLDKSGGIDSIATALQNSAQYIADLIGGTSILASKAKTGGFVEFLKKVSKYTSPGFGTTGQNKTGLQDLQKILGFVTNVNKQEKVRTGLIASRNAQVKSARNEEAAALAAAKKAAGDTTDQSKKTLEQLMAEEAARKAGFTITKDIDSIQVVAAANRLQEIKDYKIAALDAAQAQYDALAKNFSALAGLWDAQKSQWELFQKAVSQGFTVPIALQIAGLTNVGGPAGNLGAGAAGAGVEMIPTQQPPAFAPSGVGGAAGVPVAGVAQTINVNVTAGAVGSEQYLADVINQSLAQAARLGLRTTPAGYIGSP